MARIITISNHKGGVGKTTSTINIGAGLNKLGQRVLLVDLDPQANLSQSLGIEESEYNIYGAIRDQYPLTPTKIIDGLDIIPSTLDLSGAEIELSSETGREYILKELLDTVKNKYDYILIDCPPSLGLLTLNALSASNEVYIPLQAQYLAMRGVSKLVEVINKIQKRINKNLKVGGVFITQYDNRKVLNRNVVDAIKEHFQSGVLDSKIRDNVSLAEAPTSGQDIFRYNNKSNGADDYLALSKEILERV